MYPLRGALIRVRNDGKAMPRITQAHCVSLDDSDTERGFVFIVPRGENMLVLGGLAEPDEWNLDIGLHNYEPVRRMFRRCVEFLPALRSTEIDAAEPVRVGLRPLRNQNVRLELEPGAESSTTTATAAPASPFPGAAPSEAAELVESLPWRALAHAFLRVRRNHPKLHLADDVGQKVHFDRIETKLLERPFDSHALGFDREALAPRVLRQSDRRSPSRTGALPR